MLVFMCQRPAKSVCRLALGMANCSLDWLPIMHNADVVDSGINMHQTDSRSPMLLRTSGGGYIFAAWMFQQLAHLQQTEEVQALPSRLAGIILDSSPAPVTADVSSR